MNYSPPDPLSLGFPRQKYENGLSFSSPGNILDPGVKPVSPALVGGFFTNEPPGELTYWLGKMLIFVETEGRGHGNFVYYLYKSVNLKLFQGKNKYNKFVSVFPALKCFPFSNSSWVMYLYRKIYICWFVLVSGYWMTVSIGFLLSQFWHFCLKMCLVSSLLD